MPGLLFDERSAPLPIIDCGLAVPGSSQILTVKALIDTGATHCVATGNVIKQAGLKTEGTINHSTVGSGARLVPTYRADLVFVGHRITQPNVPFTYKVTDALLLADQLHGFDLILGWDALDQIEMTFARDRTIMLRFG